MPSRFNRYLIVLFLFSFVRLVFAQQSSTPLYKDQTKPIEQRVEDLLNRMTLEEKLDMITGTNYMETKPNKRLGIPIMNMANGPHGVRLWKTPFYPPGVKDKVRATCFPTGVALAASWNIDLLNDIGKVVAKEAKAKGVNVLLGPCVNIHRIPYGGRNFESYGEDPYLASRMVVGMVKGVQSENVIATTKHYVANNQDYNRFEIEQKIGKRALYEIYFPAFKAAVQEAGCWAIMSAYPNVNGEFCSENEWLLNGVLKNQWGFPGFVMSDWWAVHSAIPTFKAGLDIEMPSDDYMKKDVLLKALQQGEIKKTTLDDKIRRMLRAMFAMGIFDHTWSEGGALDTPEHRQLALNAARESIVLLKNKKDMLPLDADQLNRVAVIGPNAAVTRIGGEGSSIVPPYYTVTPLEGIQNKVGEKKIVYEIGARMPKEVFPVESACLKPPASLNSDQNGLLGEYFNNLDLKGEPAIQKIDKTIAFDFGKWAPVEGMKQDGFSIRWTGSLVPKETGTYELSLSSSDGSMLYLDNMLIIDNNGKHGYETVKVKRRLNAGQAYDLKVEYYGYNSDKAAVVFGWWKVENDLISKAAQAAASADVAIVFAGLSKFLEGEGGDLDQLTLPEEQENLILAVAQANPNTVIVLNNGTPLILKNWLDSVPALLEAWYTGQESGNAIADVIFGDINPSGKLPTTFIKEWQDSPASETYPPTGNVINYKEGIFVGYRYFDTNGVEPLFPFGYGLTYTEFEYSDLRIIPPTIENIGHVHVHCQIQNVGSKEGAEIVQLYLQDVNSGLDRPLKELKGFDKVSLMPGEKTRVHFNIPYSQLAFYHPGKQKWIVEPGIFKVHVGSSSRDIRLWGEFKLE